MEKYENDELERAVQIAKRHGLTVWTFKSHNDVIGQIFFDNGKTCGSAHHHYGGLKYMTCHRANKNSGTGFGFNGGSGLANWGDIERTLAFVPDWASGYAKSVVKESMEEHIKRDKVLTWRKL